MKLYDKDCANSYELAANLPKRMSVENTKAAYQKTVTERETERQLRKTINLNLFIIPFQFLQKYDKIKEINNPIPFFNKEKFYSGTLEELMIGL